MKSVIYKEIFVYFTFYLLKLNLKEQPYLGIDNPKLTTDNLHLISHKTTSARRKSLHLLKSAISNDSKNYQGNTANYFPNIN